MKVRYTPRAFTDSHDIERYLLERSLVGATHVMAAIGRAIEMVAKNPMSGRATDHPSIRAISVPRYPYRIFYRVLPDAIEILHVRHTARRPMSGLHEPPQPALSAQG